MSQYESQHLDFKQSWQDDHLKTLCAFANSKGGAIHLGKDDQGQVIPLDNVKKLLETLPGKIIQKLSVYPRVDLHQEDGATFVIITVEASPLPVAYHGKYYQRVGSTNQEIKGQPLATFLMDRGGKGWDSQHEVTAGLDDIDPATVETFRRLATTRVPSIATEDDLLPLLQKLNLAEGERLKRAAILLLGNNPQRFFPQSYTKVGLFASDSELLTDDVIQGNLFEQVERTIEVLKSKHLIPKIHYEQWLRKQKLEYPEDALREAVINAIVHRDYAGPPVQIRVYDDKLVVWNEGPLPSTITIADLKTAHPSRPRNQLLSDIFYKAGYIEAWGRGTITIIESCRREGLPEPKFREAFGGVELSFYKEQLTEEDLQQLPINDRQRLAIAYLKQNGRITNKDYQRVADCSRNTATNDLKALVALDIIEQAGQRGAGSYYVLK